MVTIHHTIPSFPDYCAFLDYQPAASAFFDIETTGFSPASSVVFLIGILYQKEHEWQFTQLLAEAASEEKELLSAFFSLIQTCNTLIHFNGSTFDLPYLIQKAEHYQLPHPLHNMKSIDLYQTFRSLKKLFSLERMNQISLEQFLGWQRRDQLTGKHMVTLFQKYAASKEKQIQQLLLLHNHDDLIGMTQLLNLCHYQMLPELILEWDFPASICESDSMIQIPFSLSAALPHRLTCKIQDTYQLDIQGTSGTLTIPCLHGELLYFFPDYKNYYYLPTEDQAIHKSVGTYVDKKYRQPAKPQNCYIRKYGSFLPQPTTIFEPVFQTSYDDKHIFFEYIDSPARDPELLHAYIRCILQKCLDPKYI